MTWILGISAYQPDSAAALIQNGVIVAAAQQERFSRRRLDHHFPADAIHFCLQFAEITLSQVDYVAFYAKPIRQFKRILKNYLDQVPRGCRQFSSAMPTCVREQLLCENLLRKELRSCSGISHFAVPPLLFTERHQAHAAAAFYPSPHPQAAVLCIDESSEEATTTAWLGNGRRLQPLWQLTDPHSLTTLYNAMSQYLGFFSVQERDQLMGLAAFGEPVYTNVIMGELIDIKPDGSFRLNESYLNFSQPSHLFTDSLETLFDQPPRAPQTALTQNHMDIARSLQEVIEYVALLMATALQQESGCQYLCLAGSLALNHGVVGRIHRESGFSSIWVPPAPDNASSAVGAALAVWHHYLGQERNPDPECLDAMHGAYLGPSYTNDDIAERLLKFNANFVEISDDALCKRTAELLALGKTIGWFQGRMELSSHALGNRAVLGDPRGSDTLTRLSVSEIPAYGHTPLAAAVIAERVSDYFCFDDFNPYLAVSAPVTSTQQLSLAGEGRRRRGFEKFRIPRSTIPAVTQVDLSVRFQTIHPETNPLLYALLVEFENLTHTPVLASGPLSLDGEPLVQTPEQAYRCFMRRDLDYLAIGNFLLTKTDQPPFNPSSTEVDQ